VKTASARIAEPIGREQPREIMQSSKLLIVMALPQESRGLLEGTGAEILFTGVER
jgi:hypothetical protein